MKATGIVRRIDDLGRVVIPKEIRRTLRIREGDPLEIFTDREGEIILKKYSPIGELGTFAGQYAESLAQTSGCLVCITDTDQVVAAAGTGKKELLERPVTKQLVELIGRREQVTARPGDKKYIRLVQEQTDEYPALVISPVIAEGDAIGAVALILREGRNMPGEPEQKLAACAASFLGRQMEQ